MPRRRLSERQKERIRTIQERRRRRLEERTERILDALEEETPRTGLVVVRHGANLAVEDDEGRVRHCLARQNIGYPVCGDRVVWQASGEDRGVVTAILERSTALSRPDYSGRHKPLAANLTQLVVVIAPRPEPSEYLIDQYLAAAELMGIKALILCNKADLLRRDARETLEARLARYRDIGYPVVWTSLKDGGAATPLTEALAHETSILVGQSGVGKSSLVKALLPNRAVQIGRLSKATGLGRHTTSAATCYRLPCGGRLIDSPGVRSFRLAIRDWSQLEKGFRDMAPLIGHCRFANCRHDQEPGCALKAAVEAGRLDPDRLANFRHMAARLEAESQRR
jgi:ribosome biogenesis GTPase